MRFYNYISIISLLISITIIIFGKYFSKKAPTNINGLFGYITTISTKNKETNEH